MKNTTIFTLLLALPLFIACACKSSKKVMASPEDAFIKNEIIVQLKEEVTTRQLVVAFQQYKLKMVKVVIQETNLWLFTYDTSLIKSEEMLALLKSSEFTTEAEFNKKVKLRNGSRGN